MMQIPQNISRKRWTIVGAFMVPVVIMLFVYCFLGIHPFGEKTLLAVDMNNQYISFFSYLRSLLLDGGSPLYTFSKNLGGDMAGLGAYYLLSPFNLLLLFFQEEALPSAIMLITLVKIGMCGLTMGLYLNRDGWKLDSLLFSTGYALMAYNIVYQQNIMWLDGVILLPVILIGIEKIIKGSSPLCYCLSLAAAIITNYYIGFMLCIFSVLYFVCALCFFSDDSSPNHKKGVKPFFSWAVSSALAGGISAVVVLPTLSSLQGGKATLSMANLMPKLNFPPFDMASKLFGGSYSFDQMASGLPNIYCGLVALVFCILFFASKEVGKKKKIGYGVLLLALLVSFFINTFNLIWHGFNAPNWFPYRYSFLFSFLILVLAYKGYLHTKEKVVSARRLLLIFSSILLGSVIGVVCQYEHMDLGKICINAALLALILLSFFAARRYKKRALYFVFALLCFIDLGCNAFLSLNWISYTTYSGYNTFVATNKTVINQIKEQDPSFYRLEKTYRYNHNDAMMFDYNGLSHYSSSEKAFVKSFIGKMGLRNNGDWAYYNQGSTSSVDSLLGVKYLLSKEETPKPYDLLWQQGEIHVYQNPYALPVGFMVHGDVWGVTTEEKNPFALQNTIWESMTEQSSDELFFPADITRITTVNLLEEAYGNGIRYAKEDSTEDAYIEYVVTASSDDPMYAYFTTEHMRQVELIVNDRSLGVYFDPYRYDIAALGPFAQGEEVVLKLKLNRDEVFISVPLFYHESLDVLEQYYSELSAASFAIEAYTDAYFEGTITNSGTKTYALFTIPYEGGWEISIDGEATPAVKLLDTLLAAELPEGTHHIVLSYRPENLNLGLAVTSLSVIALAAWMITRRVRQK